MKKNSLKKSQKRNCKNNKRSLTRAQRIELYKHYLANPVKDCTQEEFARKIGFKAKDADRQLNKYKHEPGFWIDVWELYQNHYLQEQLPEVNQKVVELAKAGDKWAVDLVYHHARKLEKRLGEQPMFERPKTVIIKIAGIEPDEMKECLKQKNG